MKNLSVDITDALIKILRYLPLLLGIFALVSFITIFRGCEEVKKPKLGQINITGNGITAVVNPAPITRSSRGDVSLPKVTGTITVESNLKKGDLIPVEVDLTGIKSSAVGGKHKLLITNVNRGFILGYNYEMMHLPILTDLTLDVGLNTSGAMIGFGFNWTEHSQGYLGYSSNQIILGINFRI
jgi:hypothetical protein